MEAEVAQLVQTLIGNVGFPIVAFLLMYNQNNKVIKGVQESVDKNTEVMTRNNAIMENIIAGGKLNNG